MNQPNILVIICHDLGKHLGCYGVPSVRSPNLDALAADGVRCDQAWCTAPQCSPSRASLFTGRYPQSNGVIGLTHHHGGWDLNPDERHLASHLADAGYDTALLGMQHETRRPEQMGFHHVNLLRPARHQGVAQAAIEYLDTRRGQQRPFYAQVGIWEPHRSFDTGGIEPDRQNGTWVPPFLIDEPSAHDDFAAFQGAIHVVDRTIGQILDKLRDTGLADDTLVLFTTDHGMPFPLAKCTLYDPGLEVSQIFRWPARGWRGGRALSTMTSNVDVLPTLLEVAGAPVPANVQGRSFLAALDGEPLHERDEIFAQMTYHSYYDPLRCIRTKRHKLIVSFTYAPLYMHPSQQYRPLAEDAYVGKHPTSRHPPVELYDRVAEPWEKTNLANEPEQAELRRELLRRLHAWMREVNDPLLKGPPPSPYHHLAMDLLRAAGA